jgi:hypothetical protein
MKGQVFDPLIKGPAWREIIAEAIRTTPIDMIDHDTVEEQRLFMADHILAALRRSAKEGPL